MLQFEQEDSPFYERNKMDCENLQKQLISLGYGVEGFCNAWGYQINAFKPESKEEIKIEKGTNTNGGIVAMIADATAFQSFNYKGAFKNNSVQLKFKKSILRRFFMNAEQKQMVPYPYYIKTNEPINFGLINALDKIRNSSDTFEMSIKNGMMKIAFNEEVEDVSKLYYKIENLKNSV